MLLNLCSEINDIAVELNVPILAKHSKDLNTIFINNYIISLDGRLLTLYLSLDIPDKEPDVIEIIKTGSPSELIIKLFNSIQSDMIEDIMIKLFSRKLED